MRKYWYRRLSIWRGSRLISRFFIVFIWINRLVLFGLRWSTRFLFSNSFLSFLLVWILSSWAFLFLCWPWTVAQAILWIHGCWIFIYVLRRWKWRYSLTRSRSLVSSWATSLFSWWWWSSCWWWGIHFWKVLSFWSNHRLSLLFLWNLRMRYTRSRDLDRHRCLSSCGGWSSSSSFIGIGISWGLGDEGRSGNRSHAMHFLGPTLSRSPACDGAGGHPGGRPGWPGGPGGLGVSGGPLDPKRHLRIIKEFWRRRIVGLISSFVLNPCPPSRTKCGAEKVEPGYRTTPPANWCWTGFPEEHPSSGFTAGRKDIKIASNGALENHTALEVHIRQKMTSKDCHMRRKILRNCRWIPMKDQLFPWAQRLPFVNGVLNICSHIFRYTAHRWACHRGQPFRSILDPIHDQCCFFSYAQIGKIQEVTDQHWNNLCLGYTVSKNCSNLSFCWNQMFTWVWYQLKWM